MLTSPGSDFGQRQKCILGLWFDSEVCEGEMLMVGVSWLNHGVDGRFSSENSPLPSPVKMSEIFELSTLDVSTFPFLKAVFFHVKFSCLNYR